MSFKLLSSPLQGFTDFRFRNAQNKYFGVDGVGNIEEITIRLSSVIDNL